MTPRRVALALAGVALGAGACRRAPDAAVAQRAAALAAWQGTWSARIEVAPGTAWTPRDRVQLEITGSTARIIDGGTVHPVELVVHPCALELRERQSDRGVQLLATLQFALVDGTVRAGRGPVGVRRGAGAVVCTPDEGGIFTVAADGTCTVTRGDTSRAATCAWTGTGLRVGTAELSALVIDTGAANFLVSPEFSASVHAATVARVIR